MRKSTASIGVAALALAGNLAPLWLVWLIWPRTGPPPTLLGGHPNALLWDALIALIFPAQHSIWTQRPVKARMTALLGPHLERPAYSFSSAIALVLMCSLWRTSDTLLWTAPVWWIWTARAGIIAALGMQFWCSTIVGPAFLLGTAHLKALAKGEPVRPPEFREAGPYRFLRHPIASSQVFMIWMFGSLHADRLLLTLMWTAWIILATALEDRRLAAEFGATYAAYRRRAGFLLPRLVRRSAD